MKNCFSEWTPVTAKKSENSFTLGVWNREYTFDNSYLPTEIISCGVNMLYDKIKLVPFFDGKEAEFSDITSFEHSHTDEKAVFICSANCENVVLNTAVTAEFDGFLKIDLKLINHWGRPSGVGENQPRLTGLYMDIPMKKECASLMHFWPNNDKSSLVPAKDIMNSGTVHESEFAFKPYISLGNNELGLGVFVGESDENFFLADKSKCIQITDKDEYINIRINFLDYIPAAWQGKADMWQHALPPINYTIGFQAMPIRKLKSDTSLYRRYHCAEPFKLYDKSGVKYSFIDELAKYGVECIVFHEEWSLIQNYGMPNHEEIFAETVKACHEKGIKILVYFGYEYSTLLPDWSENCDNYCNKNVNGDFVGGWQRKPYQRDYIVCYGGGYCADMIKRIEYVMDTLGVDGIYVDGGYIPWECANESHGCGYTDRNGNRRATYPMLKIREHVKNIYETVHERGGIIDAHQSSCCTLPTLAFCDSYYDGENIQDSLSNDNMELLSLDAFRAEYMGYNFGITANFIAYSEEYRSMEVLAGTALLHNVHCRPWKIDDIKYLSKIWKIFDEYGLDNAEWTPYWRCERVKTDGGNAYASLYETDKFFVATAVNYDSECFTLKFDENIKNPRLLTDGEVLGHNGNSVDIKTTPNVLNIIVAEKI